MHIAVWESFTGNAVYAAVNGTSQGNVTSPGAYTIFDSTVALSIGATADGLAKAPSGIAIDELRICVDTIDYDNSSFTPPTSAYA